jgi:hypothetical protein
MQRPVVVIGKAIRPKEYQDGSFPKHLLARAFDAVSRGLLWLIAPCRKLLHYAQESVPPMMTTPGTTTAIPGPYPQRGYLSRQQLRPGAVPRKQLNATPETMRMLDELLVQIRQQSMEKDVRTSEVFHAMVLSVYEARAYLDLSAVPPRGRWGSPTAASLPVALKNAFMDAISRTRPRR